MAPNAPIPVGRIARWKVTYPVRFYTWPAVALLFLALAVDLPGSLPDVTLRSAAGALLLLALEFARVSSYSPVQLVLAAAEVRQR